MNNSIYLFCLTILLGLSSCRDVIIIDLEDSEPQIVIEGVITDQPGPYQVSISQSISFYETNNFPAISGAEVIISDDAGEVEVLEEISSGVYETSSFHGVRGRTYTVAVRIDGQEYTASSTIPLTAIPIDSLVFDYQEESIFLDEGYLPFAYFTDPSGEANYYNLNIFVNGLPYDYNVNEPGESPDIDNNYWLIDDKFTDGRIQDFLFFLSLKEGDVVEVELHHLDKSTYDYYRTLLDITEDTGVAPANPLSNFSNGALGYFGAYGVSKIDGVVE